ncbi:unnamed protein product [Ixodes persulcatus]
MDPRVEDIRRAIRSFKDFPKKGILFRDVLPIFHNPDVFRKLIDVLAEQVRSSVPDVSAVVGIEARGFIIAPALALALNVAFVPVRKPGKLPGTVKSQAYTLEYGEDKLEVQEDGFLKGRKVVIVDDLLATGGDMQATTSLLQSVGATVSLCMVIVELEELGGRQKVTAPFYSLEKMSAS